VRKIVVGMFVSLDGVMEGPGPADDFALAGWTMPYWDDAIGQYIDESAADADALLLGRVTYQAFEAAFGGSEEVNPNAATMNNFPKYVVSTTLEDATWRNSTLIKGNVVEEITRLKQQPGKNINISGSGTLVQTLMDHGLVDELNLLVYPVVLGQGKRLFKDGSNVTWKLAQARTFNSGVLHLTYELA
jgi:dihydrofolate reductase